MALESGKFTIEIDAEATQTAAMVISCSRPGCRRPVRPELLDNRSPPTCDDHQKLIPGDQRWSVYSPVRGWVVDVVRRVFSWDAEACQQWGTPEQVSQDLTAGGLIEPMAFKVMGDGNTYMQSGLTVLRMR